jgi:truncated hemoglobin YjbI
LKINQEELQNLRHLIGSHQTAEKKLNFYADNAQDPQVKQLFQQSAQSAGQTRQKLMSFLS